MADLIAGTYPYRNRHAIMDAVQAGLLPHTRQESSCEEHWGCVTVIVKVTAPPIKDEVRDELYFTELAPVEP